MSIDLFTAIETHDISVLRTLLKHGADPDAPQASWPGLRPLHAAIYALEDGGSLEAISLLLEHGADVNAWDQPRTSTPLIAAITSGQRAAVERLLRAGADPNVRNGEGDSPLRLCAAGGDALTAALLLQVGATKTIDEWGGLRGYTALGLAASRLDLAMMKLLLDAGADRSAPDEDGHTARERLPPRDPNNAADREVGWALLDSTR